MSLDQEQTPKTVHHLDTPPSQRFRELKTELEDVRMAKSELIQKVIAENLKYSMVEDDMDELEREERRILSEMQLLKQENTPVLRASPFKRAMRHLGVLHD